MDDAQIIDLYWKRDESAITETAQKYGALCRSVAKGILTTAEDAEECINDAYHQAWNAIPPQRPENWGLGWARWSATWPSTVGSEIMLRSVTTA